MHPRLTSTETDAKKLETRAYIRNKQRLYRQSQRDELSSLKEQVWRFEGQLQGQQPRRRRVTALPWREVSAALAEETTKSVLENRSLKRKLQLQTELAQTMHKWTAASTQELSVEPRELPVTFSLTHVPLLASGDARKLGFDWMTQIMYHNTERIFEHFRFPSISSSDTIDGDFVIDTTDLGNVQYGWRHQVNIEGSFEHVCAVVRHMKYLSSSGWYNGECVSQQLPVDMPPEAAITYRREWLKEQPPQFAANLLYREFKSKHRCVIVGQNVPLDESIANGTRRNYRKSLTWVVLDRVSESVTKLRILGQCGHKVTDGSFAEFELEALAWRSDLKDVPEARKEEIFRREATVCGMELSLSTSALVEDLRRMCRPPSY